MFFFFKQKTAYEMRISDWSSDVCSSDLLAANQAQRLARYLAALRQINGAPPLTLGLQNGSVPEAWKYADPEAWEPTGRTGEYLFPFFMCPEPTFGGQLAIATCAGPTDKIGRAACGERGVQFV